MPVDRTEALELHRRAQGKIKLSPTISIRNKQDLAMAYIQGGAIAAKEIQANREAVYELTGKRDRLAIISNGTSLLGQEHYGPEAALPMIEGKCLLYKRFGDVNALPLCVNTTEIDQLTDFCRLLAPTVGAINLEDIKSPTDFLLVRKLRKELDIPIFADDMHCSSAVILGSLFNALKVVGKELDSVKIVIVGAGTSAIATAELMLHAGAQNIVMLNRQGIIHPEMESLNGVQRFILDRLNPEGLRGGLETAIRGADILIGLTGQPKAFGKEHVALMAPQSVVFPLTRPVPEMTQNEAKEAGAAVVGCGIMDGINCMPNLAIFPGFTRGILDVRATGLTFGVQLKVAREYADNVDTSRLGPDHITPFIFSDQLVPRIAEAVAQACVEEGLARIVPQPQEVYEKTWNRLFGGHIAKF
ncbi:MAG: NAD-dependent malic enzyme [Dethiosulfovibrio peptidovorans]|nr:MAG: NAD-dependent malic enzyme [Dethiosulfovibrio peptidovorans]